MATTVANFGIGVSMQTSGIIQPLHHAGAAIGSFSQQVGGLYLPTSEASRGFGVLEDAMELLALRAIATETSLANLIHTTGRIAGASRAAQSASQQNTVVLQREAAALTNISALRDRLLASLSQAPAGRPRLINTDSDIQDIMRLRREIELIRSEGLTRRRANLAVTRTGQIDTQVADLQARAQSSSAQMSGQSPELLRQANVLLQERAAIEARLNSQLPVTLSDTQRVAQANAAINDVLTRRSALIAGEVAAHRDSLRLTMQQQNARPPSQGGQRREYNRITDQIDASVRAEERLNQAATRAGNTQEQNTKLAARATAEAERRNGLMARQAQLQRDILTAQQASVDARKMGNRLIVEQNRAYSHAKAMERATPAQRNDLERELAIRNQVNAKMQVFNANLRDRVKYQGLSVDRAQQLSREYRAQERYLAGMNARIRVAGGGMGRMGFAMQNVGYGIEDAVSQFGTRGLAGAIGAASNNISAFAMIFNSIKIQLGVSIGLALLQIAIQTGVFQKALVALGFTAEDTNKKTKDLAKTFDELAESQVNVIDHQQSLNDLMDETSSVALANRLKGLRVEYAKLGVEKQRLQAQLLDETERKQSIGLGEEIAVLKRGMLAKELAQSKVGAQEGVLPDYQPDVATLKRITDLTAERAAIDARINQRTLDKEDTGRKILANAEGHARVEEDMEKSDQRRLAMLREELVLLGKKSDLARTELGEATNDPKVGQQNLAAIIAHQEDSVRLDEQAITKKKELHDWIKDTADAERDYLQAKKDLQKAEAKAASPGAGRPSLEAEADEARDTILILSSKKTGKGGFFGVDSEPEGLSAEEEQVLAVSKRVLAAWRLHYKRVDGDKAKAQAAMEEADAIRTHRREGREGKQGELDFAVASQKGQGEAKVAANKELLRTKADLLQIERDLGDLEAKGVQKGQDELTRQTSINQLLGEQATAQGKLNTLTKAGESAREKADKTLGSLAGGLSKEIKKEQERASAAKDFREELERATELGMQPDQVRDRLAAFDTLNEKTEERDKLLKEKESLKKDLSDRDKPATQQNAVEAGSAEAARIVADAILGGMNEKENQPLIDAMLKNKEALDLIESAIRDIPVLNIQVAG